MYYVFFCDREQKLFSSNYENLDEAMSFVECVISSHCVLDEQKDLSNDRMAFLEIYKDILSDHFRNDVPIPVFVSDIFKKNIWEK